MDRPAEENRLKSRILWLLGRRRRVRINGDSMSPLLRDGDEVFVDPGAYASRAPRVGDVVLSAHPYRTDLQLVKAVGEVREDGNLFLVGANCSTASTDSRSFGAVPMNHIRGKVVSRR